MELILLVLVPLAAGLLCLTTRSRAWWEGLNLGAFAIVAGLAFQVAADVAGQGPVTALGGFLRADALSALVLDSPALCRWFARFTPVDDLLGRVRRQNHPGAL